MQERRCIAISEFGIKIKNMEASTLLEYNLGIRDHYEQQDSLLTNSLFLDYLKENGLKTQNGQSTRDVICLEFHYGTRSYEEEMEHLCQRARRARLEYKLARSRKNQSEIIQKKRKRQKLMELIAFTKKHKDTYVKTTKEEIRRLFYNQGVNVEYVTRKKDGTVMKREVIHYLMLYRSTGKAKKGSCMFIRDKLYKKARNFLYMGIKLPENNPKIVEISAYAPLVSSTIVDKIQINPDNILILKDIDHLFTTDVISIETDSNHHCLAKHIKNYTLKNTLFDGQALLDSSLFPKWGNGYLLLRHHFCKMAAFCSHIQSFFKDYFGEAYEQASVLDMFGRKHFVKDIQVITTDNAMKWLKFDQSYDSWCEKVRENGCMFGVVKTAHESKLGEVQKMSYQMVNALEESTMDQVVKESVSYVNRLKQDDSFFLEYLKKNRNFSNDYEVLAALCEQNFDFTRSSYFRTRKEFIIKSYILNMKSGKLLQNAENLVIVGSPYGMLLYGAAGTESATYQDTAFQPEHGAIQCYTKRFDDGEYLAFFRSPFNSRNNLTYLHNTYSKPMETYFDFGKQIIAVNMAGTDFQDRNNGSDQDSDSGYCTNQPEIVEHAKRCTMANPTIVNNIPKANRVYHNTMDDYAVMDNGLANTQKAIGESSNLAQLAQTYACNYKNQTYHDSICILSVLAQIAIDHAKRQFEIDLSGEIRRLKNKLDINKHQYPSFWRLIRNDMNPDKINSKLHCPMNYLYKLNLGRVRSTTPTLPMSWFFRPYELPESEKRRRSRAVESLIQKYSLDLYKHHRCQDAGCGSDEAYLLLRNDFDELIGDIRSLYLSRNYVGLVSWLVNRAFMITPGVKQNSSTIQSSINTNKSVLLKVLYESNPQALLQVFSKNS